MKILVAWYGAFDGKGTLGDYLSVKALTRYLDSEGFRFECASSRAYEGLSGKIVRLDDVNPGDYDTLMFCCGPVMKSNKKLGALVDSFGHTHKIGIGVSLFPRDHFNYYNPFDYVLSRENGERNYEDIAIAAPASQCPERAHDLKLKVGLVLRNKQGEYGADNCKSDLANRYLWELARHLTGQDVPFIKRILGGGVARGRIVEIDNHLGDTRAAPEEIECRYRQCDLILTTRFHGAVTALRNAVPVIAIDQISGGAKVFRLLARMGYPHVCEINQVDVGEIRQAASDLLQGKGRAMLEKIRSDAQGAAQETLEALGEHLKNRLSQQLSEQA